MPCTRTHTSRSWFPYSRTTSAPKPTPTPTPSTSSSTKASNDADGSDDDVPPLIDDEPPAPPEPPKAETEEEKLARAERTKEQGNVAFKAKRYGEALDHYSTAVGVYIHPPSRSIDSLGHAHRRPDLNPSEPAYLTNRAAAYMALKKFRPALADCQAAADLQSAAPQAKTLVRLARCQLSLGTYAAALSTLRAALDADPTHAPAWDLQKKVRVLEGHLASFETAKAKKQWAMARLSLDQAVRGQEAEGGIIPVQWRLWRVEVELARGGWDAANTAAKYDRIWQPISRSLAVLTPGHTAMRFDWSRTPSTSSPCVQSSSFSRASSPKRSKTRWRPFVSIRGQKRPSRSDAASRTSSG
jgi:DnaJ homolog subfamily C member 7